MPASNRSQPDDPGGSFSSENAPRVVVRAEKYFLCTACGTQVEIPADVVGQVVATLDRSPPEESPSAVAAPVETSAKTAAPARAKRAALPRQAEDSRERIDGLIVPTGKEMEHALAWVSFHLKVLDRQNVEIKRLGKLLEQQKKAPVPCRRPRRPVREERACVSPGTVHRGETCRADENHGTPPERSDPTERGPP